MNEFIKQCIINRKNLEFSYKDMSNCLIDVSEEDYEQFEKGNYIMDKENIKRIMRVLCVKEYNEIDINDYIDTTGLDEEEIKDLSKIVCEIVGDGNDWFEIRYI